MSGLHVLCTTGVENAINDIGFFSLGAFVGAIVSFGLAYIEDFDTSAKAITIIIPAALGGTAMTVLQLHSDGAKFAISFYSMGLMIAVLWAYCWIANNNLKTKTVSGYVLGIGHYLGVIAINCVAATLLLFPVIGC